MISGDYTIRRPVSPQDRCDLIDLQATIGRTVGTHINAPLQIFSTTSLRVDLLGSKLIDKAIKRSPTLRALPTSYVTTMLKEELPATAELPLENVAIEKVKFVGRGALQIVGLQVNSPDLNREQDALVGYLQQASDLRPIRLGAAILPVAIIGAEHADDVEHALEPSLRRSITLEPVKFAANTPTFRRAS